MNIDFVNDSKPTHRPEKDTFRIESTLFKRTKKGHIIRRQRIAKVRRLTCDDGINHFKPIVKPSPERERNKRLEANRITRSPYTFPPGIFRRFPAFPTFPPRPAYAARSRR